MLELGLKFTAAYLIGSFLGSLVVGRLRGGVDIRKLGSGNAGGTNALRTQGKAFALFVMLIDVGKGIAAVILIPGLDLPGIGIDAAVDREVLYFCVAFAVILGHIYPVWYGFRGGKGGATAAGLLFVIAPALAPVVIALWIAIVFLTGFVGLATMLATVGATLMFAWLRLPEGHNLVLFSTCVSALIIFTHRGNIVRMLKGTESRMGRRNRSA
ncbi:MAG: glycerol-3-phosphate 1-O-acyltransferase PlsY [Gammaproteobacteria bacterium]|jgi:glycerol-3-phosphate acyltransferase PlsY